MDTQGTGASDPETVCSGESLIRTRPRQRPAPRPLYGALDLGTNNCRLLIARRTGQGDIDGDFQVVDAFSRVVRLGEGLMANGSLSPEAMGRSIAALKACAEKLEKRGVSKVRSVATEACRSATNAVEFVRRVYHETGIALDVITPAEEARLAVLGCQSLIDRDNSQTLVFDIGGGSTELAITGRAKKGSGHHRGAGNNVRSWLSIPWGVVSLAETEPPDFPTREARFDAYIRMRDRVSEHLSLLRRHLAPDASLLGASGTVTTLASLSLGLVQYDRRRVDGVLTSTEGMIALSHQLALKSPSERAAMPGVGPDRADLVVAGCAILEALLRLSTAPSLRVADRGIREGILRSMIIREAMAA